jgi:hypothetical protein
MNALSPRKGEKKCASVRVMIAVSLVASLFAGNSAMAQRPNTQDYKVRAVWERRLAPGPRL